MIANFTWINSDDSSSESEVEEEEEIVNMCFMAQSEQEDEEVNDLGHFI